MNNCLVPKSNNRYQKNKILDFVVPFVANFLASLNLIKHRDYLSSSVNSFLKFGFTNANNIVTKNSTNDITTLACAFAINCFCDAMFNGNVIKNNKNNKISYAKVGLAVVVPIFLCIKVGLAVTGPLFVVATFTSFLRSVYQLSYEKIGNTMPVSVILLCMTAITFELIGPIVALNIALKICLFHLSDKNKVEQQHLDLQNKQNQRLNELGNQIAQKDQQLDELRNQLDQQDQRLNNVINRKDLQLNKYKTEVRKLNQELNKLMMKMSDLCKQNNSPINYKSIIECINKQGNLLSDNMLQHNGNILQQLKQLQDEQDYNQMRGIDNLFKLDEWNEPQQQQIQNQQQNLINGNGQQLLNGQIQQ